MFKFEINIGNIFFFFIEILTLKLLYLDTYILSQGKNICNKRPTNTINKANTPKLFNPILI